jgi:NTP pyrophosphatase (non-canonical NTP hydrolase)
MHTDEYQQAALKTMTPMEGQSDQLIAGVLGLNGEAGEVSDIIKKWLFNHRMEQPLDTAHVADELGDVLWYIAITCDAIGIPLSEVARRNIEKLNKRHGGNGFKRRYKSDTVN